METPATLLQLAKSGKLTVDDIKAIAVAENQKEKEALTSWAYLYAPDDILQQLLVFEKIFPERIVNELHGERLKSPYSVGRESMYSNYDSDEDDVSLPSLKRAHQIVERGWAFALSVYDVLEYDDVELTKKMLDSHQWNIDPTKLYGRIKNGRMSNVKKWLVDTHFDKLVFIDEYDEGPRILPLEIYERALRAGKFEMSHLENAISEAFKRVRTRSPLPRDPNCDHVKYTVELVEMWKRIVFDPENTNKNPQKKRRK